MQIEIEIPEELGQKLEAQWGDISQRMLVLLVIEAYRSGLITSAQIQSLLNLSSRWEVEELLKRSQTYLDYTSADLEEDIKTINKIFSE